MPLSAAPIGPVRILLVEDSPEDAELTSMQLVDAGLEAEFERVDTEAELARALATFKPDLVLSDLSMPGFSGHQALQLVRGHQPPIPFIFVSGTMGEETAVQALREGAADYILKDKTARLPSAAARAIREARSEHERARVEKELLRSQRLDSMAMLAAGLSHDLRNILQPLLIVPDLLAIHSDNPKIHKLGEVIAESGRRGHEMAESMLSFVRGARKAREDVSVGELFQAVQVLLQGTLPDNVRLDLQPPATPVQIDANYVELQQVLINLCLNAIQAMPTGGTLTLSARPVEEGVCIRVADEGIGMDAKTRSQLFTPFFTTKSEGTGLGLMSCLRIVEQYQGRIEVDSTPGVGTTFAVVLPVTGGAAPQSSVPAPGQGQRILLVDGDSTRQSLLRNALESQGYAPATAPDGAYALRAAVVDGMPELFIIDSDFVLLPATALVQALVQRGYRGPVLLLQDPARPFDRSELPAGLRVEFLDKPLEMGRLFHAVAEALQPAEG
ncbi:hybrid sensor histidine kinase/response regulator [Pseudoxanthomonas winnipegensis]|jgi:signal transduction histidine kinase|uniref:histidine kinase n=1 Tax=Pseudoxanthomonas winnipegensis TaxID=2480810 RepID=A0ABY1WAK0_9GAMM|nr:ATP-binding protein [Pseudoxanthomonas winnipegensis]TAA07531.1 hybrid sensor histidine kinase/response regulator [Pseudoxanthomonas winnipegensis]TAA17558.1 hybrid sensor histidine kinase/response regulator [Pseudoxanthomonas winnipegensis]TAH71277.1 hybrid sensor histidine kinase/response regulator [Pseudoxanthomonas winnipegensis]